MAYMGILLFCALLATAAQLAAALTVHGRGLPSIHTRQDNETFSVVNGTSPSNNGTNTTDLRTGPTYFYLDLDSLCHEYIDAIQTRPRSALDPATRKEILNSLGNCTTKNLYQKFPCRQGVEPPLSPVVSVEADPENKLYPSFEPLLTRFQIFESSTEPFLVRFGCIGTSSRSKDWQYSSMDDADVVPFALSQTPIQYMRCTTQVAASDVPACVSAETSKLGWLPAYMFAWSGQSTCSGTSSIFVSVTFDILSVVSHVGLTIFIARRRGLPPQTFSFVNLWVAFLVGIAKPFGEGLLLNLSAPSPFTFVLPFLRPTGFSIAAAITGIFGSRGWGVQYLAIDSIVTLVTFLVFNLRAPDFWNGRVVVPVTVGAPDQLQVMYNGMFVATLPGALFVCAYMVSGMWPALLALAVLTKTWAFAKLAFKIWLTWMCFFLVVLTSPFLAIWEMVWKIMYRKEAKTERFPAVRWYAAWFTERGELLELVGVLGYWTWVILQFSVFVGRWMVLANLLPLAGDAWCPGSLKEVEAGSALSTIALVAGLLGLKWFNLIVLVCGLHGLVECWVCCTDYSFMNQMLGRNNDDQHDDDGDKIVGFDGSGDHANRAASSLGPQVPDPGRGTGRVLPGRFTPPSHWITSLQDDFSTFLIHTDGACLDNDQQDPRAGWAF
ncbi:hypothetical protein QBC47DRAFT_361850 [Echria macrotheca]|uniref:Transmembrane protein n=1 Tax=Echria macrotheca TaxID=438768 RepID=A0AAJ0BDG7_9PEZI|nr:hypothetical protein QBC47DRAFT_361850 [Echria macrotheca]